MMRSIFYIFSIYSEKMEFNYHASFAACLSMKLRAISSCFEKSVQLIIDSIYGKMSFKIFMG